MDASQGIDRRTAPPPDVPGVGEVTARIKDCLEGRFADVWVAGEVTNVTRAASGTRQLQSGCAARRCAAERVTRAGCSGRIEEP